MGFDKAFFIPELLYHVPAPSPPPAAIPHATVPLKEFSSLIVSQFACQIWYKDLIYVSLRMTKELI